MSDKNMWIYEQSRKVPASAKKQFNNGKFSGTDISPMWRIKKLTELFGPCGVGWYYEVLSERSEQHHDMTMAIVDLNLYIKVDGEWSKPIYGTGGNALVKTYKTGPSASDEGYKMALTDALSVACKALGIGADVYWDRDATKYTQGGDPDAARMAVLENIVKGMEEKREQEYSKATKEQVDYILANADDERRSKATKTWGENLEHMNRGQAEILIKRIQGENKS